MEIAYIGMGSNLGGTAGDPAAMLGAAAGCFKRLGRVLRRSSLYRTRPVGFLEQPDFVNAVVEIETSLPPHQLLSELLAIEQQFGRIRNREQRFGPRTLDLDLLLYGNCIICDAILEIPHPRLAERRFVLAPLCEMDGAIFHPILRLNVSQLLNQFDDTVDGGHGAAIRMEQGDWLAGSGDSADCSDPCAGSKADEHRGL